MELGVREWFLILGGLMIAGVLAHGAWIFFRSRRNEIGLQYERNIPDADIDDLELLRGELPSGGARVRPAPDGDEPSASPSPSGARPRGAASRAPAPLDADAAAHVPVLMDPIDRDLAETPLHAKDASADTGIDAAPAPTRSRPSAAPGPARSPSAELADDLDELDGILSAPRTAPVRPDGASSGARRGESPGGSQVAQQDGHQGGSRGATKGPDPAVTDGGAPAPRASVPQAGAARTAPGVASSAAPGSTAKRPAGPGSGTASRPSGAAASAPESPEQAREPAIRSQGSAPRVAGASRIAEPDHDMEQAPLFAGQPIVARERSGRDGGRGRKPAAARATGDRGAASHAGKVAQGSKAAKAANSEPRPQEPPEDVIVIQVLCRHGGRMPGPALLEVITDRGLRFGDMNIFHRYAGSDRGRIEFSLASAVEPGTFDLGAMDDFETPGVTLFLQLPGPEQPLDAFEDMVGLAKALADELDAELKDEQHSVMTAQTIEHCRNRIREFTRRQMSRRA